MILVVNLNLAVDYVLGVRGLVAGAVHRAETASRAAGGKGVNVARVLRALEEPCVVAGFLGGRAGDEIASWLADEGVELAATPIRGESRTCAILVDAETGRQTVVNEPGPSIAPDEV